MIYKAFADKKLSMLGFGTMRLPLCENGKIDEPQVGKMTAYAIEHGVNYFDTAYPYHGGESEVVIGRVLKNYPRESYYLATKYPGHQLSDHYDPAEIFEEQLQKCGVDYFDFYLLHNVYENSLDVYLDPKWGIIDYFKEQKRLGRIKHLGFSSHGSARLLEKFLDAAGEEMEFCQIQLNYLDWTLQDAKAKVELLNARHIPVWVMEPVRGGRLVNLEQQQADTLNALRPNESIAAWGFRFLQDIPGVTVVLSGMSNMAQMEDNVKTFEQEDPLSERERSAVLEIAEGMKHSVPCTSCRYCTAHCPMGLDIPMMLSVYNELKFATVINASMRLELLPEGKGPSACIGCGKCANICPQFIKIPGIMDELAEMIERLPKWADLCKQRAEEARARKQK